MALVIQYTFADVHEAVTVYTQCISVLSSRFCNFCSPDSNTHSDVFFRDDYVTSVVQTATPTVLSSFVTIL